MNLAKWFQEEWVNRVRQFGLLAALSQAARAIIRTIWQVNSDIVLAICDHHPNQHPQHTDIKVMSAELVESFVQRGELTERRSKQFKRFLDDGYRGFMAISDSHLAGYGFVQPKGIYAFGTSGKFQIPAGMMMFKNLHICPEYRGGSLGKKVNQVRLAAIPEGYVPLGFVIVENRYAIRNLKMFGFEEMLIVIRTTWLKKWTRQRVTVLNECEITRRVIRGLESVEQNENR